MVNPRVFINVGDKVKLNDLGLSYAGSKYENEIYLVKDINSCPSDFESCVKGNGLTIAKNCTCHVRYTLENNVSYHNDIIFDEMDIVDLK